MLRRVTSPKNPVASLVSGPLDGTLSRPTLLWKRRQVTEVLWATVILVGVLVFLRSYW